MHIPLIVGGAGGIGLALAHLLAERHEVERVYIVDRNEVPAAQQHPKFTTFRFDLETDDFDFFGRFTDIDALLITAGFGRLSPFRDLTEQHIISSFAVNTTAVVRLIHRFFSRIESRPPHLHRERQRGIGEDRHDQPHSQRVAGQHQGHRLCCRSCHTVRKGGRKSHEGSRKFYLRDKFFYLRAVKI